MSIGDHLEELRKYLIRIIVAIIIMAVVVFINKDFLFEDIILAPKESYFFTNKVLCNLSEILNIKHLCINSNKLELINIQLAGQFSAHIMISIIVAIVLVFPFALWQLWLFIKPGLYKYERKGFHRFVFISSVLFITGTLFAYIVVVPLALNFLGNYSVHDSVANRISLMSYVNSVSLIPLTMGLVFQLPVFVFFFTRIGWLTPQILRKNRKIVFILILILSAIITPPEVFSLILVALPLYVLYEISIKIASKQNITKLVEA